MAEAARSAAVSAELNARRRITVQRRMVNEYGSECVAEGAEESPDNIRTEARLDAEGTEVAESGKAGGRIVMVTARGSIPPLCGGMTGHFGHGSSGVSIHSPRRTNNRLKENLSCPEKSKQDGILEDKDRSQQKGVDRHSDNSSNRIEGSCDGGVQVVHTTTGVVAEVSHNKPSSSLVALPHISPLDLSRNNNSTETPRYRASGGDGHHEAATSVSSSAAVVANDLHVRLNSFRQLLDKVNGVGGSGNGVGEGTTRSSSHRLRQKAGTAAGQQSAPTGSPHMSTATSPQKHSRHTPEFHTRLNVKTHQPGFTHSQGNSTPRIQMLPKRSTAHINTAVISSSPRKSASVMDNITTHNSSSPNHTSHHPADLHSYLRTSCDGLISLAAQTYSSSVAP
eukprot:GHVQ01009164.1.p1 GENE.GHVQ01009164.1~~GHVQ01009164.1.p1  ORF type:complete len:462 (-),score=86.03 GHVQ01009164.1:854-2038(-)